MNTRNPIFDCLLDTTPAVQPTRPERLSAYLLALRGMDWTYEFSDDHDAWRRGKQALEHLQVQQRELDPDKSLWRLYDPATKDLRVSGEFRDALTAERLRALVSYDPQTGVFTRLVTSGSERAGLAAGSRNSGGYLRFMVDSVQYQAHRLAWLYVHGRWPNGFIDHINGDRSDNRIANLRECTKAENAQNTKVRSDNKAGVTGVYFCTASNRWRAYVFVEGQRHDLGDFQSKADAVAARLAAKAELHPFQPTPREMSGLLVLPGDPAEFKELESIANADALAGDLSLVPTERETNTRMGATFAEPSRRAA